MPDDDTPDDDKVLTQAEATALATKEAAQARRAAKRETEAALAEQLGCTVDEAKAIIAKSKEADQATQTEAEKALAAANEAKAAAAKAEADAKAERLAAKVERKLTAAGVPETALARAARMVVVDPDADDDAITAEVDALKTDIPALFAPTTDDTKPPGGPGVPPVKTPPRRGGQPKSMAELGRETLRQAGIRPRDAA